MPQLFHRRTNTIARVVLLGGVFFVVVLLWVMGMFERSPYVTRAGVVREQPVPFSHEHHVSGVGIDCRYCHTGVETSSFAGLPPTSTCMNCHSEIWPDASVLEPVRASYRTGQPIAWVRVNDLPDFVYFDHSIHVAKGVACVTCHGPVGDMPLPWRENSLQMQWCLQCHRDPGRFIGERAQVFNPVIDSERRDLESEAQRLKEYHVKTMTNCSTCHR